MPRNPFSTATREGLLARMEADGCRTFSDKLRWVEEHIPSVTYPAAFVGALVRDARKNPEPLTAKDKQRAARVIADWRGHERPFEDTPYWSKRFAAVEETFAKTRPTRPLVLYRNERTDIDNQYGQRFTSWSTRPGAVEGFGWGKRRMVWTTVPPEAVLVQVAAFGPNIDRDQMDEVIVRPGRYNIEPFPYNYYMRRDLKPPAMVQNPVDPRYSIALGEGGAFTQAFAAPDPLKSFYDHEGKQVDRGPHAVETVTAKQIEAGVEGWGDPNAVDASKILLLLARDRLKNDKKALAYLPALELVRVDYSNPRQPELIFTMPAYQTLESIAASELPTVTLELRRCLDVYQTRQGTMGEAAQKFADCVRRKGVPAATREAPHVIKVLHTLHELASSLPLTKHRADMHEGNLAVDKDGHLILLDPMVAELNWTVAEGLLHDRTAKLKQNPRGRHGTSRP